MEAKLTTGIKRTKLRLVRCRARMAMNHRDRINDARADQNLVDVMRVPAPWDVKPPVAQDTPNGVINGSPGNIRSGHRQANGVAGPAP